MTRNYDEKLWWEIMTRDYDEKLSTSILLQKKLVTIEILGYLKKGQLYKLIKFLKILEHLKKKQFCISWKNFSLTKIISWMQC